MTVCGKCGKSMIFEYAVEVRETLFEHYYCRCGERHLERIRTGVPVGLSEIEEDDELLCVGAYESAEA